MHRNGIGEAVVWNTKDPPNICAFHLDPDAPAARVSKESERLFSQQECRLEVLSIGASDQGKEVPSTRRALLTRSLDALATGRRGWRVIIEQSDKFTTSVNGALNVATRIL